MKTIRRYHYTPTSFAEFKKSGNMKCRRSESMGILMHISWGNKEG